IYLCQFVEARVHEVHADIPSVIETLLLSLFGTVAAVVKHDTDEGDTPAYGSIQLLRRIQKSTVSLQAHRWTVRSPKFSPEPNAQPHAESPVAGVVEHGTRHLKVQAIISQTRGDTGIDLYNTNTCHTLAQLWKDPLRHHRLAAKFKPGLHPSPATCCQGFYIGPPCRIWAACWVCLAQGLEQLLRHGFGV